MSLYRKWRSRSFEDLVGQDHVVRTLRHAVRNSTVAHAYLFTGPRGTGKTSTARILAKAVNCLHPVDGNPCNECAMCLAANEARAMDVIEIDAASNTSVDNVRELRERVGYAAGEGRYKVYIVDEVHRLSGAAFDAFLKTLEEPPPHVIFVFASTEPHKVPETIVSRCQRFDFRRIAPDTMLARLQYVIGQEGIQAGDDALRLVVQGSNGSLRDALGLLDQVGAYAGPVIGPQDVRAALGLADPLVVSRLTDALLASEVGAGLDELERFVADGGDPRQLSAQLVEYWRALLLQVSGSRVQSPVDPALDEALARHASVLDPARILAVLSALADSEWSTRFNVPPGLPLEVGFVRACLAVGASPAPESEVLMRPVEAPDRRASAGREPETARRPAAEPQPKNGSTPANGKVSDAQLPPAPPPAAPAADPAPSPPPARAPGGSAAAAWPDVIAAMRPRSRSLQALIRDGFVVGEAGDTLTVGFKYKFHADTFADVSKRRLLEDVVEEVLGRRYRVSCVRADPPDVAEDDGFVSEVVDRLRAYHAGELHGQA